MPEKAGGNGSGGENLYSNRCFFNAGTVERKRQWRGMQSNKCSELEDCLLVTLLEFLSYFFFVFSMLLIKKNAFYLVKGNSFVCTGFLRENHHLEVAARRK